MHDYMTEEDTRRFPDIPDPRLPRIVTLRLEGKTWDEIRQDLKCDPKTLYELRRKYDVDAIVSQLVEDQLRQLSAGYGALLAKANAKLHKMLDSSDPDDVRFAIDRVFPKGGAGAVALPAQISAPRGPATREQPANDRTAVVQRASTAARRLRSG